MKEIDNAFSFNERPSGEANEKKYKNAEKGLGDNAAEKVISGVANVNLIFGILGSLIACMIIFYKFEHPLDILGIGVLFGGVFCSVVIWARTMVIANISNNIRQIKYEVRKLNGTTDNVQAPAPEKEKEQPTSTIANPNEMYVGGIKIETEE